MRWAAAARLCWARTLRSHCPAWRVPQQAARGRPSGRGRYIQSFIAGSRLPESDSCQHASCLSQVAGQTLPLAPPACRTQQRWRAACVSTHRRACQRPFRGHVPHALATFQRSDCGPWLNHCRGPGVREISSSRADHSRPPGLENPVSPPLRTYFVASRTVWFFRRPLDPGRRGLRRLRVGAVTAPAAPIEEKGAAAGCDADEPAQVEA